jgi:hypothetical protein
MRLIDGVVLSPAFFRAPSLPCSFTYVCVCVASIMFSFSSTISFNKTPHLICLDPLATWSAKA